MIGIPARPDVNTGSDNDSVRSTGSISMVSVGQDSSSIQPEIYVNKGFEPSLGDSAHTLATQATEDSRKPLYGVDENEERGNWTGRFDFLLSLLGYAVGLGNIWRFPYLAYRNGGGAFLIPYVIMMGIVGVPLFYLEATLGQFCSCGPMTCWEFAPIFKGVGISMVIVSALTSIYYNMVLAWAYYYLFLSLTSELPWQTCNNKWNTKVCSLKLPLVSCEVGTKEKNGTCSNGDGFTGIWNESLFRETTHIKLVSPAEEYWNHKALAMSPGIETFGVPKWDLVLCLMLAWVIVFFCLIKGIKSTGKVVYFTALFPYVVLTILFFRGVTLEGAGKGVEFFIKPTFERLLDGRVWKDAAVQIFFSLSIAGGGLVTLSSYNRFHNNILVDTIIVSIGDIFTCIFGGFVIFSFLGYMAHKQGTTVDKVAADGAGLAFVVYPDAVTSLPAPPFWSILFFLMLITLGLDSQFAMVETVLTGTMDQYPYLRSKKTFIIFSICCIFFILGLPLTCPGGMYLLQLMDNYVGGWTLLIIGFSETIAVIYCYGVNRFFQDLEVMLGKPQWLWWKICWYALSPAAIMFIFVFTFVDYTPSKYGDYLYPAWADAMGWIMAAAAVIAIPITALYKIYKTDDPATPLAKLRFLITPTADWGPALVKHRALIKHVQGFVLDPYEDKARHVDPRYRSKTSIPTASSQVSIVSKSTGPRYNFSNDVSSRSNISMSTTGISQVSMVTQLTMESNV
ncbi:hypothetical protein ACJMK2_016469 [Sinanodonta woodiana]|uniref:Transporter n=1 Tax=Sinanodonta woodiana TaxID=1069815 RepID=A0ABD3UTV6_SINWO